MNPPPSSEMKRQHAAQNTYEQLAVELQVEVSVGGGPPPGRRKRVQAERRLPDVALGPDAMPPVVVQGDARLHADLQRAVADVQGEHHPGGGWRREGGERRRVRQEVGESEGTHERLTAF